jgi:lipoate-protein ligase A
MADAWRLLVTAPLGGPPNMAIDEALLRTAAGPAPWPTVRFYAWDRPTVSLGYAQSLDAAVDRAYCAAAGIPLVRRATGGSALLHEPPAREVTYSVTAGAGAFPGADDVLETYRVVGRGLAAGFARLGAAVEVVDVARARRGAAAPAFCFARTGAYEIAAAGKKLVGSAQRRRAGAFLQHGAVLLSVDRARLEAVFPGTRAGTADLTTLETLLGRSPGFDEVVAALAAGLASALGAPLSRAGLTEGEARLADRLVIDKYGTAAWTERGELDEPGAVPARGGGEECRGARR